MTKLEYEITVLAKPLRAIANFKGDGHFKYFLDGVAADLKNNCLVATCGTVLAKYDSGIVSASGIDGIPILSVTHNLIRILKKKAYTVKYRFDGIAYVYDKKGILIEVTQAGLNYGKFPNYNNMIPKISREMKIPNIRFQPILFKKFVAAAKLLSSQSAQSIVLNFFKTMFYCF